MTIRLTTPRTRPAITRADITQAVINYDTNTLDARITMMAADGEPIEQQFLSIGSAQSGQSRFTAAERAAARTVKNAIYRLLIADGVLAGTVE